MANRKIKKITWLVLLIALVLINFIASKLHYRFDLTEEKRYSITSTTKDLLNTLPGEVSITVFLKGEYPTEFKRLANATQEFLNDFREEHPSKVRYQFIDPQEAAEDGKIWADSLSAMGASPINLSVQLKAGQENKIVFPYALIQYGEQRMLINLFQSSKRSISVAELNNAEAMMEYQFAKAIDKMADPQRPMVAYAVGNGQPTGPETFDLQQVVGSAYSLGLWNIGSQKIIPDTIKVLLVVKPATPFSEADKLKLDQYIMRGGKVVWFIDNLHAEQDSLSFQSKLIAYDRGLNISDILFNYGVRINADLLMDLQCDFLPFAVGGSPSNTQYEFLQWNYYPLFESQNNHLINKNLGMVAGRFVNSIDTVDNAALKKIFLLQSSPNARTLSTPAMISPNENRTTPNDALFNKKFIPTAILLEGRFTSFFKNRIGQAQMDSLNEVGGYKESSSENKMIVVADGDIVLNDVSKKQGPLPMGMNIFTLGSEYEYQFANRDFLLNCLEYLTSKTNIIQTRNKEIVLRMLDPKRVIAEKTKWQLINIVLPIVLIIFFGIIFQRIRRYRFASA